VRGAEAQRAAAEEAAREAEAKAYSLSATIQVRLYCCCCAAASMKGRFVDNETAAVEDGRYVVIMRQQ